MILLISGIEKIYRFPEVRLIFAMKLHRKVDLSPGRDGISQPLQVLLVSLSSLEALDRFLNDIEGLVEISFLLVSLGQSNLIPGQNQLVLGLCHERLKKLDRAHVFSAFLEAEGQV